MNLFKKFKDLFSSTEASPPKDEPVTGEGVVLLKMPYNIVHPADLLESLLMAIASHTRQPIAASLPDIKLYSLYDRKDNSFLGSFYALEFNDGFYGNLVGSPQIFFCAKNAFCYKQTDELYLPLKNENGKMWVLECRYDYEKIAVTAISLNKMDETLQNSEILHKFEQGTSFNEAYSFFQKAEAQG